MCRFDSAENCIFGFCTGDFQSHKKTKILFSKSVLASFIFHSRLIRSVSADREDLQSDRRHRREVSHFLAHRGPTPAPFCAGEVVILSGFTPGSGPARGLSEGGVSGRPTGPPWDICSISRRKESRYSKKLVADGVSFFRAYNFAYILLTFRVSKP